MDAHRPRRQGSPIHPWIVIAVVFAATYLMFAGPWGCATDPTGQADAEAGGDLRDLLQMLTAPDSLAAAIDSATAGSTSVAPAPREATPAAETPAPDAEPLPAAAEEGPPAPPAGPPAPDAAPDAAALEPPAVPEAAPTPPSREEWERRVLAAPHDFAAWLALSAAHRRADAPSLALRAARRAMALAPGDPRGEAALAFSLLALRRTDEALDAFERVCASDAENADAWNAIGYIWLVREDLDRARDALERATCLPDCPAHAHNNLGIVYERIGCPEWADREYGQCLALDPEHPTAAQSRARVAAFLAVRPLVGQSQTR